MLWPAEIGGLPHMVDHANAIKSPRVGCLCDLDQRGAKLACPSRTGKIIQMQSQFHNGYTSNQRDTRVRQEHSLSVPLHGVILCLRLQALPLERRLVIVSAASTTRRRVE